MIVYLLKFDEYWSKSIYVIHGSIIKASKTNLTKLKSLLISEILTIEANVG